MESVARRERQRREKNGRRTAERVGERGVLEGGGDGEGQGQVPQRPDPPQQEPGLLPRERLVGQRREILVLFEHDFDLLAVLHLALRPEYVRRYR